MFINKWRPKASTPGCQHLIFLGTAEAVPGTTRRTRNPASSFKFDAGQSFYLQKMSLNSTPKNARLQLCKIPRKTALHRDEDL
jgi:hypothetical protein